MVFQILLAHLFVTLLTLDLPHDTVILDMKLYFFVIVFEFTVTAFDYPKWTLVFDMVLNIIYLQY